MNKQEAIEIIEQSKIKIANGGRVIFKAGEIIRESVRVDYVPLEVVVNTIDQIHKPQKVVVPKFRAWVEAEETMHPVLSLDWSGIDDNLTVFVPMGHTSSRAVSIDNAVLMQSTGLFDTNDKEIFEGDVVELHHFTENYHMAGGFYEGEEILVGVIRYGYTDIEIKSIGKVYPPGWLLETSYKELSFSDLYGVHEESFEIIGNIYQNPELVEGIND